VNSYRPSQVMPPVVKGLLIINVIMFLATYTFQKYGIDLVNLLGLHFPGSVYFHPYQIVTHMFMHGGIDHILFNMLALWMFGSLLENVWGPKRFLFFYLFSGLGSVVLHLTITGIEVNHLQSMVNALALHPNPGAFDMLMTKYSNLFDGSFSAQVSQLTADYNAQPTDPVLAHQAVEMAQSLVAAFKDVPVIGASGAIFGLLVAFGMLFPNQYVYVYFFIPVKAKYFVIFYGLIELYLGISGNEPGVAHFAHLGGALFGFLLVIYWNKTRHDFY